jgi:hypothetical protein
MRDEDDVRTKFVAEACQQKFPSWQAAIVAYTNSYNDGHVVAYPEPNTRWWMEPIRIYTRNPTELAADTSTSSEEAMWATFEDEDAAARDQLEWSLHGLSLDW